MKSDKKFLLILILLFLLVFLASITGRYQGIGSYRDITENTLLQRLITQVRIPRIIMSLILGAGLAVSGLVMQTVFQNSLAEPGVLGISQAAGFGAALGYLLFPQIGVPVQFFAFISGIIALIMVLQIARKIKGADRVSLIFAGIAVSALFSAGLGIIKYIADPMDQLPSIVFWLLGGISTSNWRVVLQIAPITLICIILLYLFRWRINVYALNDSVLYSLGVKRKGEVYLILGISVLLTTSIISFSGLVGWVGLIIPNITRLSFGYDLRSSLPASILLGAIFVLVSDTISRTLIAGEIPLGIITAFLGAIVFVILIFGKGFPLSKNG
jgi:iron complex transport system permease protein